ncbi:MAG: flavin reductase family protein, partial [Chloroflexota bacterium]
YSFFNAVCSVPPTVMFCPAYRETPNPKDTLTNIRETETFVVNFVSHTNGPAMNMTAQETTPDVNEFERAGLTAVESVAVPAPRVAESPINFECKLQQIVPVSEQPGGGYIVIGTVVHMHVSDDIYDEERGYVDFEAYDVIGRMAGNGYVTTRDPFTLVRPPSEIR